MIIEKWGTGISKFFASNSYYYFVAPMVAGFIVAGFIAWLVINYV